MPGSYAGDSKRPKRYFPFAEGPRSCVGQSLAKVSLVATMATLVQHFQFCLADEVSSQSHLIRRTCHAEPFTKVVQGSVTSYDSLAGDSIRHLKNYTLAPLRLLENFILRTPVAEALSGSMCAAKPMADMPSRQGPEVHSMMHVQMGGPQGVRAVRAVHPGHWAQERHVHACCAEARRHEIPLQWRR